MMAQFPMVLKKLKAATLNDAMRTYSVGSWDDLPDWVGKIVDEQNICTLGPKTRSMLNLTPNPPSGAWVISITVGAKSVNVLVRKGKDGIIGMSLKLRNDFKLDPRVGEKLTFEVKHGTLGMGKPHLEFVR